jgi:PPP family 3-phenylpropionic acid transporter
MHRLLSRFGALPVLLASFASAALRWLVIGWLPDSLPALLGAQLLHAATFGAFHASAIHLVYHYFRGRLQGRGQALYSSLAFGAGGAVGSFASGLLWDTVGPALTFSVSTLIALLAVFVAYRWIGPAHAH